MNHWRPGDRRPDRASMLRVNQAGEYGATRIYAGQLAVLRANCPEGKLIARMAAQEQRHLKKIDQHYSSQLAQLGDEDPELASDIAEFQADELEHRDTARAAGATNAVGYPLLTAAIRAGCRVAIGLSKRI